MPAVTTPSSLLAPNEEKEQQQQWLWATDFIQNQTRFAFLSHGSQDDPIYCFFNQAALDLFQYSLDEIYQLPSRYSAPPDLRSLRQTMIDTVAARAVDTDDSDPTTNNKDTTKDDEKPVTNHTPSSTYNTTTTTTTTTMGDGVVWIHQTVRQSKYGDLYRIQDIILWNVYDEEGYRVGQAAIIDTDKVTLIGSSPTT